MSVVLQLLIAVEKGDVHTYKGMSLSDISVADLCKAEKSDSEINTSTLKITRMGV